MGNLTLQAGSGSLVISRDPKLGIVAAKLKCHAPDLNTALFGAPPDIGLSLPEWQPRSADRRSGGEVEGYDVVISLEGHPAPDAADGESFELDGTTSEKPIESHWNFQVLLTAYEGIKANIGTPKLFPAEFKDKGTGTSAQNPMHGVDSWAAPGLIWNRNWCDIRLPESLVRELGTISKAPPGNPPVLSGNRDWLCMRIRATHRGNIWQIQQSWQLSGPRGWVPEMYPYVVL